MRLVSNRWHLIVILVVFLAGCKSKQAIPEGAPVPIREKELLAKVAKANGNYENLRVRATGNLNADGQSQNFRLELRLLKDSLIWVELADPVLGLKLARGLVTADSLFFINRIDREYFKGDLSALQEKFGIDYGFQELQNALSGNLVLELDRSYGLYYVPGSYLLSSADPKLLKPDSAELTRTIIRQAYIDPVQFKAKKQVQINPETNETYELYYQSFQSTAGGIYYPQIIELIYGSAGENSLRLASRKIEQDNPELQFPFNIPSEYAEMR